MNDVGSFNGRSSLFSKIEDEDYVKKELSRITFLYSETGDSASKISSSDNIVMEEYQTELALEGALISPMNKTCGYLTAYNAIYTYVINEEEDTAQTERLYTGNHPLHLTSIRRKRLH